MTDCCTWRGTLPFARAGTKRAARLLGGPLALNWSRCRRRAGTDASAASIRSLIAVFGRKPTIWPTCSPPLNTISVGMLRMLYLAATIGFSSVFSLRKRTLPSYSPASSFTIGATMRHGPHHGAQKSTSTGTSALITSVSNVWSRYFLNFFHVTHCIATSPPESRRRAGQVCPSAHTILYYTPRGYVKSLMEY